MVKVGFIGVGQMGRLLAQFLLKDRYPVVVFDIDPKCVDQLVGEGAEAATGPNDLTAKADVVITVLTYPKVVEEVLCGKGGVVEGLTRDKIVIETSSIDAETSIRVGREIQSRGGRYLEAALIGPPPVVAAKQLIFLTAGDEESARQCEPLFQSMGKKSIYVGGPGKAKLVKIANAMVYAVETTALYEALAWAMRNDVSPEALIELRRHRISVNLDQITEILKGNLTRRPNWVIKDVYHGLMNADAKEIPMPLVSTIRTMVQWARSQGMENYPFSELMWKLYEQTLKK
ncbi:MAG TPA: NAD(P)-dependent oxidoreductase [Candidatus Binatia bacterium]